PRLQRVVRLFELIEKLTQLITLTNWPDLDELAVAHLIEVRADLEEGPRHFVRNDDAVEREHARQHHPEADQDHDQAAIALGELLLEIFFHLLRDEILRIFGA